MSNSASLPGLERITDPNLRNILQWLFEMIKANQEASRGPESGTLEAIPKHLKLNDNGRIYQATDYDRLYRWNGATWVDAGGQIPRRTVAYFPTGHTPVGWARCNGGPVLESTSDGRRVNFQPPTIETLNTLIPWIRI
jgi:hypothetical protein